MNKEIKTENQPAPAVAGQVEFGVRPDVPEVNFEDMPMGAVYTPSLGRVGAAMYTYTAGQMIQYTARKVREARDAERERCLNACAAEQLQDEPETEGDLAYFQAVQDCLAAIRGA